MKRRFDSQKKEKRQYQVFFRCLLKDFIAPKCAVKLTIFFFFSKPKTNKSKYHTQKPDADNLEKFLLDAGNTYLWHDDCQIVEVTKKKLWLSSGDTKEKTEVIVEYLL